jgi:Golgi phosphoprotein 3 GPP34
MSVVAAAGEALLTSVLGIGLGLTAVLVIRTVSRGRADAEERGTRAALQRTLMAGQPPSAGEQGAPRRLAEDHERAGRHEAPRRRLPSRLPVRAVSQASQARDSVAHGAVAPPAAHSSSRAAPRPRRPRSTDVATGLVQVLRDPQRPLLLAEQWLLLLLSATKGRIRLRESTFLPCQLRALLLIELALRDRLGLDELGHLRPVSGETTGQHPLETLASLAAVHGDADLGFIDPFASPEALLAVLEARGALRRATRKRFLVATVRVSIMGFRREFRLRRPLDARPARYEVRDHSVEQSVRAALFTGAGPDPRMAVLIRTLLAWKIEGAILSASERNVLAHRLERLATARFWSCPMIAAIEGELADCLALAKSSSVIATPG